MKRSICFVMAIALLLASCAPATEIPAPTNTIVPSETSTNTPLSTATERPTETPTIPTLAFVPLKAIPVSASSLTLTEFNAGTEMKRLNVIGTGTAHDLEFSPDGTRLAVATGRGVFLYDGTTFEQSGFINVNDSVSAIAFSPDGNMLAVAVDGKTSLWNVKSGQHMMNLDGGMIYVSKLAYGFNGQVAAIGGECRGCGSPVSGMILWDGKTGHQIFSQHEIWYSTSALRFVSDGKQLAFGGRGGINIIESETGKQIAAYQTGGSLVSAAIDVPYDFIFNHDGTKLFVTSFEESSEIFDIATQVRIPFTLCDTYLTSNSLNGACSKDQKIVIFDLNSGDELQSVDIDIDASSLGDMFVLSPDNNFLVYYGKTGVDVVDIKKKGKITEIQLTDFGIAETGIIKVDGVEKYAIATLTYSGQVEIYDIQTGELIQKLYLDCCEIKGFNFAPNQKTFATIDRDFLRLWDLQTGQVIYEVDLKDDFSGPLAFSPDGSSVFLTHIGEDYVLDLDLQSGKSINQGHNSYAYNYADPFAVENYHFNTQGDLVMLGYEKNGDDNYPSFRDVATDEKIILPYNAFYDNLFLEAFSFSSNGKYIAFGNITDIFVWNLETLKLQAELKGHEFRGADGWLGKIRSLDFSPQSNLLVSVGYDGTIRFWNARFGNEIRRLNICCSVDFTPDGRYLITYGDGVAIVWGIPQ